jgi:protein-tyrosine phosphatase
METRYSRIIPFEEILNFRDLGGYKARGGRSIAWRRIYRSGEMHVATDSDISRLKDEIKLKTVIDLRSASRQEITGVGRLGKTGVKFYSVPISMVNETEIAQKLLQSFTNSAELYIYRIRSKEYGRGVIEALEIIASPANHPLVFHCNAGKDRSGIVAAILLSVLGVSDEDIVNDFALTALSLKKFIERWDNDPKTAYIHKQLPAFHKDARPEEMTVLLTELRKEYGSAEGYLKTNGADASLVKRLEKALLV